MKRIIYILLFLCLATTGALAQQVSGSFKAQPLSKVLETLVAQQSDYSVSFVHNQLEGISVTKDVKNKTLPKAIREICKGLPVKVTDKGKLVLVQADAKPVQSQTINLVGYAKNSFTHYAIDGVKVSLLSPDSVVIQDSLPSISMGTYGTIFAANDLPHAPQKVLFRAMHPDYETTYMMYEVKNIGKRVRRIDIPDIMMKRIWEQQLDEVEVKATRIKMVMRGDTIVYDARAFSLPVGSMLDALIKQLPGAELKSNGEIFVNGRKIDYLTLNSKEFFRGNNRVMLDNLPYYTVKEVKVYEKNTPMNEFLEREVEEKDYVMDVELKKEYSTGYLGNTDVGYGNYDRYIGRLFALRYGNNSRVSLFANLNNLNQAGAPGASISDGTYAVPRDLTRNKYTGLDIFCEPKDRSWLEIFNFTARWSDQVSEQDNWQQTFLSDRNSVYRKLRNFSNTKNTTLHADQIFSRTLKNVYFYTRIIYDYTRHTADRESSSLTSSFENFANDTTNFIKQKNRTEGHTSDLFAYVIITPKLNWGDDILIEGETNYISSRGKDYAKSYILYNPSPDYRHDYGDTGNDNYSVRGVFMYTMPFLSGITLKMGYIPKYEHDKRYNNIFRLDVLDGWNNQNDMPLLMLPSMADMMANCIDLTNTHEYFQKRTTHGIRFNFDYSFNISNGARVWTKFNVPVDIVKESADFTQADNTDHLHRTETLFKPNSEIGITWREEMSQAKMTLGMDMSSPDMAQMFVMTNNRDALNIREGNPNLRTTQVYRGEIEIEHKMKRYGQMFRFTFGGNSYHNLVTLGQTYNSRTGIYTFRPENVDGNWDINAKANYSINFGPERCFTLQEEIQDQLLHSVDYSTTLTKANNPLNTVNTHLLRNNLSLTFQRENLSIKGVLNTTWRKTDMYDVNMLDFNWGMEGTYTISRLGTSIQSSLNVYNRKGYGDAQYNASDYIWNISVSQPLLKNGKLVTRFEAFDLFNQISSIEYMVNAQGRSITTYRCLPRYMMLHLVWMWNKNPKKR